MFSTKEGIEFKNEQAIFPICGFDGNIETFKCLGTGFFITELGGFITAKHVFVDHKNIPYSFKNYYAIQTLSNNQTVIRTIRHFVGHEFADLAIGMLGEGMDGNAIPKQFEVAPKFQLSFKALSKGDQIMTFGYPNTLKSTVGAKESFTFKGNWSNGEIVCLLEEGGPLLRNMCYQTTMFFDSRTSGGPVFHNHKVIGINSTSMDVAEGEQPISYITPIELLLDIPIDENGSQITLRHLVMGGFVDGFF